MIRKRKWKNKDGTTSEAWSVDISYEHPDGRVERIRKTAPGTTRREAEAYERQLTAALINGTYNTAAAAPAPEPPAPIPTWSSFCADWLAQVVDVHYKPSSARTTRSACEAHLTPALGELQLDQIDARTISALTAQLSAGRAPKTVNNLLGVLSTALSTAVEWGHIPSAPTVRWLDVPPQSFDFLDFDEADRLLEKVEEEWRCLVLVALRTGMRLGELCALRWQDVDLVKRQIRVMRSATLREVTSPKNGKARTIPISAALADALRTHRAATALKGELVFCDDEGGMLSRDNLKRIIPRACRLAGLREVGWHDLRHTYASQMVMLGIPVKVVQELLGHATLEMTMRYAHLAPDTRIAAVELLETREVFGTTASQKRTK